MESETLKALVEQFAGKRMLVVGDVMLDTYLSGTADRISPEAPVPVVNIREKSYRLGGAANVALNIKALGAEPLLCAVAGKDEAGSKLHELLNTHSIDTDGILQADRPTTQKTRILSHNQQMLRFDTETRADIDAPLSRKLLDQIQAACENGVDGLIFQDYDKGVLHAALIAEIVKTCRAQDIPTAADPKQAHFFDFTNVTLFKPNLRELTEGLHMKVDAGNPKSLQAASQTLRKRLPHQTTFITLADKGIYVDDGQQQQLLPAHVHQVSDVSGAGDTVISIAALGLAAGTDPFDTARLSNIAGGVVCREVGVFPIQKTALINELNRSVQQVK